MLRGGVARIRQVTGGSGNDIIVGNGGNILRGGAGRDILIAGSTASRLDGGAEDDIVIGGWTDYDTNERHFPPSCQNGPERTLAIPPEFLICWRATLFRYSTLQPCITMGAEINSRAVQGKTFSFPESARILIAHSLTRSNPEQAKRVIVDA